MFKNLIIYTTVLILFMLSCTQKSEYEMMVERGLNSDRTVNEIFLGYEFGMTRQEFLDKSWQMNQDQIISGGTKVEYFLEELNSTVKLDFFPEFKDGEIFKMPVTANYIAWSPWNEQYNSDNLIENLKDYYEKIYSTEFIEIVTPQNENIYWISIEGNREIRMYKKSNNTIQIDFTDLCKIYKN